MYLSRARVHDAGGDGGGVGSRRGGKLSIPAGAGLVPISVNLTQPDLSGPDVPAVATGPSVAPGNSRHRTEILAAELVMGCRRLRRPQAVRRTGGHPHDFVGDGLPVAIFSSVDFPQSFRPSSAVIRPSHAQTLAPLSTWRGPKERVTASARKIGSA